MAESTRTETQHSAPSTPPPSADRIALALVGCGGMGHRHVLALKALADAGLSMFDLVAVCDLRRDNAELVAGEAERLLGLRPEIYTDLEKLLAWPTVQAVDVVTEAFSHHQITVPALEAGKHCLVEKPLGLTVRACQVQIEAARRAGKILATAENLRRDLPNRVARAALDAGLIGAPHLMVHNHTGGDDYIIITPWRHLKTRGTIALDMAVHYTDIIQYYLGEFDEVYGTGLLIEPIRRRRPAPELDLSSYHKRMAEYPETIQATGEDGAVALFKMKSGVYVQFACVLAGRGGHAFERTIHGREGKLQIPIDRTGGPVKLTRADGQWEGDALLPLLPGFQRDPVMARLFTPDGATYQYPFSHVDPALNAIEIWDFGQAILQGREPEVDGVLGMKAVAAMQAIFESQAVGRSLKLAEVESGAVRVYQAEIDEAIGLG